MLSLGFGDIAEFPFLTPPDSRGVKAAFDLLVELGAVSMGRGGGPRLTKTGRRIARMPIDPRFARMLVEAGRSGVAGDVLAIVAGLSIQDVRERPEEQREQAQQAHARFVDPTSDFLTLLNLWNHLREKQRELGSSAFRRLVRAEFLNYVRVREWFDVHRQLRSLTRDVSDERGHRNARSESQAPGDADGAPPDRRGASATAEGGHPRGDEIHRALLAGLLSQIGVLDERETRKGDRGRGAAYRGARNVSFQIFPGSGLKKAKPKAVMAAELVETSRLFARTVARIDPAWAEDLAGDLVKRQVSEPHWSKDSGAAVAVQKVTLYGVEIVPRRRIRFARVDGLPRASCSSGTLSSRASRDPATAAEARDEVRAAETPSYAGGWRRSRSANGAATSSRATRRCTASTTSGCPPRSSTCAASRRGGAMS